MLGIACERPPHRYTHLVRAHPGRRGRNARERHPKEDLAAAAKKAVLKEQAAAAERRRHDEAEAKPKAEEQAKAEAERQRLAALTWEERRNRNLFTSGVQARSQPEMPPSGRQRSNLGLCQDEAS